MEWHISRKDAAVVLSTALLTLIVFLLTRPLLGETAALTLVLVLAVMVVTGLILEVHRRITRQLADQHRYLDQQRKMDYRQVEALFSLFFTLQPKLPLPDTRGWAAPPDFLKKLVAEILQRKPELVMEASSGVSTLVIAYCLKQNGKGKVVSLENELQFAEVTRQQLAAHGLSEYATVLHAPLTTVDLRGERWLWYDTGQLDLDRPIDVLVVDGPPGHIQKLCRYPALPMLYRHLNQEAIVLLDDGAREDEREIVRRWEAEFDTLSSEFLDMENGTFVVYRNRVESAPAPEGMVGAGVSVGAGG